MLSVGIDLGKQRSRFVVKTQDGTLMAERTIVNDKAEVQKFVRGFSGPKQAAMETCNNSFWMHDVLAEEDVPTKIGHSQDIKLIVNSKCKTDAIDADKICDLLRADFFPEIHVPNRDRRALQDLMRARARLVRGRTTLRNRIHSLLERYGVTRVPAKVFDAEGAGWFDEQDVPIETRGVARLYWRMIQEINGHIKPVEQMIREAIQSREGLLEQANLLATIPGVGAITALSFIVELGDVDRFVSPKKLHSYLGIVPAVFQSSGPARGGKLTKEGSHWLRWLAVEAAWAAIRGSIFHRRLYERQRRKLGQTRAILPVARALIYAIYHVWRRGEPYETVFGLPPAKKMKAIRWASRSA